MTDSQLVTAIFAAPFLTLSLIGLVIETRRIRAVIRAERRGRK